MPAFIFSSGSLCRQGFLSFFFFPILVMPEVAYFWQNVHYWQGVSKKSFARELSKQKKQIFYFENTVLRGKGEGWIVEKARACSMAVYLFHKNSVF